MQPQLRQATSLDVPAIEDVVRRAYSPYISRIGREPGPMSDDYGALVAAGRVHVLERDNVVEAVLVLIPERDAMLLDNVAVDPRVRGSGRGRTMLEYAERAAKDAGYQVIRLYTNEAMAENLRLYSRIGYVETHRVEEKGLRRVYMAKALN